MTSFSRATSSPTAAARDSRSIGRRRTTKRCPRSPKVSMMSISSTTGSVSMTDWRFFARRARLVARGRSFFSPVRAMAKSTSPRCRPAPRTISSRASSIRSYWSARSVTRSSKTARSKRCAKAKSVTRFRHAARTTGCGCGTFATILSTTPIAGKRCSDSRRMKSVRRRRSGSRAFILTMWKCCSPTSMPIVTATRRASIMNTGCAVGTAVIAGCSLAELRCAMRPAWPRAWQDRRLTSLNESWPSTG
jgi:hypothetical protein